jgi:hypothetical protein
MGCNGNSVFQGAKVGVIAQMKENVAPFSDGNTLFYSSNPLGYVGFIKAEFGCSIGSPFIGFI